MLPHRLLADRPPPRKATGYPSALRTAALATLFLTFFAIDPAAADTINLQWNPNPVGEQVAGYLVYVGSQPGVYSDAFDVGTQTAFAYTAAIVGQQYFFAVAAYDQFNNVGPSAYLSGFSNAPPSLTPPGNHVAVIGQAASLQLAGADPEGLPVTYGAVGLPPGLSVNANTGLISGTPSQRGIFNVTVTVSDGVLTTSGAFELSILEPPTITITSPTSALTFTTQTPPVFISGTAGDAAGISSVTWASNRGSSGTATGKSSWSFWLTSVQPGNNVVTVTAHNTYGFTNTDTLTVVYVRTVTAAATVADKTYDGTTAATLTTCTVTGALGGDVLGCTGTATFATADPGAGKTVTVTGLRLTGAAAGNYVLATTSVTTTASIAELNVAPLASTPTSPIGETGSTAPTFTWAATPNVGYYLLSVDDAAPERIERWYTPAQAGCAASSTCSVAVSATLAPGLVRWNVLTWNSVGYGPWSPTATVVVGLADPATLAPSAGAPAGPIGTRTPTFAWTALANATWYQLEVTDSAATVRESWFTPTEACVATACSVTPNVVLSIGPAQWRLRAWSATGSGDWTAPVAFETAGSAPGKATLISPAAPVPTTTPTFTWNAVIGTSYYLLRIVDRDDAYIERWYRPSQVGCQLGTGTCTISPNATVKAGLATWQILTWNGSGYGPWSAPAQFVVDVPDPSAGVPEPVSPSGTITASSATYTWASVAGAIAYRLSIRNNGGPSMEWWYTAAAAGCAAGTQCTVQPLVNLASGTADWTVQAWTTIGHGNWSTPVGLVVTVPIPTAPVLVSPVGPTVATPSFVWQASPAASLYYVSAYDSSGLRVDRWLTPAAAGCGTGTGACTYSPGVTMNSGAGSWLAIAWNPSGYSPWSATNAFVVP